MAITWSSVGSMFAKAWRWISSAAKPLVKPMLSAAVQAEGDALQLKLEAEIAEHGPAGVDKFVDAAQAKFIAAVGKVKFAPAWLRDGACRVIQEEGDRGQALLREAARVGGPAAVRVAFDRMQAAICARIEAL